MSTTSSHRNAAVSRASVHAYPKTTFPQPFRIARNRSRGAEGRISATNHTKTQATDNYLTPAQQTNFKTRPTTRRLVKPPDYAVPSDWRTEGSRYLRRWVIRSVVGLDGILKPQLGYIAAWLSAKESDFQNSRGRSAGLYRCVYVGGELDGDAEDLELHETTATLWQHACGGCNAFAVDPEVLRRHCATCKSYKRKVDADAAAAAAAQAALDLKKRPADGGATTRGKARRVEETAPKAPPGPLPGARAAPYPFHALPGAAAPPPQRKLTIRLPAGGGAAATPPVAPAQRMPPRAPRIGAQYQADTELPEPETAPPPPVAVAAARTRTMPLVPRPSYEFDVSAGLSIDIALKRGRGLAPLVLRLGPREAVLYRADRDGGADPERVVARAALPAQ